MGFYSISFAVRKDFPRQSSIDKHTHKLRLPDTHHCRRPTILHFYGIITCKHIFAFLKSTGGTP
jgi:hypothetical protein